MRETPHTATRYSSAHVAGSQNPLDTGTIRRKGPIGASRWEILRDFMFGRLLLQLDTQWITGFVDGEGCFDVGINANAEMKAGVQVLPEFTVVQHRRDLQILNALKAHFGCGVVRTNHGERMAYRVRSQEHLLKIVIPFFMKHPLKTRKNVDFLKFRDVLLMMERGEHLTPGGLEKIRQIAAKMNRGSEVQWDENLEENPDLLDEQS